VSETPNPWSKSTASTTSLSAELLEQLKRQLAEPLFQAVSDHLSRFGSELQYAQIKIQVLEERLRLHRIAKYGPGSEKLTNAQLELLEQEPGVSREEVEAESERDAIGEEAGATESNQTRRKRRKHPGRQSLPAHLPRVERVIGCTSEQCVCTGCGSERVVIGYEESEQLDVEPARYFVLVTKREKRACKGCEEHGVVTAPLVPRIIEKSLVSDQIIIDTVIDKYASHLPLYRQSLILQRDVGIELSRATLDGWVMRVGELLTPIVEAMRRELLSGSYIQADETPVDVQSNSRRGRNHHAYLWQYGKPGGSVVFDFRMGRGREGPKQFLGNFEGILQTDGYAAYGQIGGERMVHAACWAHARRAFFEAVQLNRDDVAATRIVAWIDELFAIDAKARDENMDHAVRHTLRRQQAPALLEKLRRQIEQCQTTTLPAGTLGKACRYTLALWTKLTCFLEHPELELSNNLAENSMRPVAIGRKNWIHVGSAQAGPKIAAILSVVESCRRRKVPVRGYLATVLPGLNNASIQRVTELTPVAWAAKHNLS
jgi:transposase